MTTLTTVFVKSIEITIYFKRYYNCDRYVHLLKSINYDKSTLICKTQPILEK